jgi:transcriptional regulator with XRE-family HTH domain
MDVVELLGRNVRRYRKLKGMTQEQLALEAGMERSYVSDLERGERNSVRSGAWKVSGCARPRANAAS